MKRDLVLMTRSASACQPWADVLAPLGKRLVYAPCLLPRAIPLPQPQRQRLASLAPDTACVFTSARAVAFLEVVAPDCLAAARERPAYAVGAATAAALAKAGFSTVFTAEGDMASLSRLLTAHALEKTVRRIVHYAGEHRAGDLAQVLADVMLPVEVGVVYTADLLPLPTDIQNQLAAGEIGRVLLFSARVAAHVAGAVSGIPGPGPRRLCVLSSRIADVAMAAFAPRCPEILIAERPDIAAMLTLIDA